MIPRKPLRNRHSLTYPFPCLHSFPIMSQQTPGIFVFIHVDISSQSRSGTFHSVSSQPPGRGHHNPSTSPPCSGPHPGANARGGNPINNSFLPSLLSSSPTLHLGIALFYFNIHQTVHERANTMQHDRGSKIHISRIGVRHEVPRSDSFAFGHLSLGRRREKWPSNYHGKMPSPSAPSGSQTQA